MDALPASMPPIQRRREVQAIATLIGAGAFTVYSRSWIDTAHLVYDIPAAIAVYGFIGQLVAEALGPTRGPWLLIRFLALLAMSVVTAGREFLGWTVSGHLTCVLAVAIIQAFDVRLGRLERVLYWIPLPVVLAVRWSVFDRNGHSETWNAVAAAVFIAAIALGFGRPWRRTQAL